MDEYVHRSSKKKPEQRQEVEEGLLKLVAKFYGRIRPALFAWLRPLEVAKEILLGIAVWRVPGDERTSVKFYRLLLD